MADLLTLVQIYSGHSKNWRTHCEGACAFLRDQAWNYGVKLSDFEWMTTQSLYVNRTIGDTSVTSGGPYSDRWEVNVDPSLDQFAPRITSKSSFGFTIGATKGILEGIARIERLSAQMRSGYEICEADIDLCKQSLDKCRDLCSHGTAWEKGDLLSQNRTTCPYSGSIVQHQLKAFIAAAYIFMYRSLLDATPQEVQAYVAEVFETVERFFELGGGNLTLWPAFIAAVEAYEDEDVAAANRWLDKATRVGMGNRFLARTIVQEVWRRREVAAQVSGIALSSCCIDWREVMKDLDIDISLV